MAKPKNTAPPGDDVIVVTVEEMVAPETSATTDLVLQRDTVQAVATDLATRYANVSLADVSTAEGLENVKRDHGQMVKFRNALDKRRLAVNKQTNSLAAEIQSWFTPTETKVKAVLDEYKRKEDARIEQERLAKEKLIREREQWLYNNVKAIWNGSQYQLGTVFCSKLDLESDDATWAGIMEKFKAERVALDHEAHKAKIEARVKDRKMQLLEMGATAGFELDGEPCEASTPGAQYGLRLGNAWAVKADWERNDDDWRDGTLADFLFEKTKRDNEAAADRKRKADETARLDEIERQRKAAEANVAAPVVAPAAPAVIDAPTVHEVAHARIVAPGVSSAPVAVNEPDALLKFVATVPELDAADVETYLSGAFNFKRVLTMKIKQVHGIDAGPLLDELFALMAKKYGYTV